MIAAVRGTIEGRTGDRVTISTRGGVSYDLAVPLGVLERLPADGTEVELRTVLVVREDSMALYGFDRELEQVLFQRFLSASGVGPRMALALLSTLGGNRVLAVIKDRNIGALCTVPGIGKKTAERLIIELRDKLKEIQPESGEPSAGQPSEQALQALVNLGYSAAEAERVVSAALSEDGSRDVASIIRNALQLLAKGK